jgi:O-antigen/teichoic acid export membrane protein
MAFLGVGSAGAALILALFAGRTALRLIYGPVYSNALGLLLLFILTAGVNAVGSFLGYGMTAARRFKAQVPVYLATLFSCGLASWILVPRWGIYGAAVALIVSALTQVIGSFTVVSGAVRHARSLHSLTREGDPLLAIEASVCEYGERL